MNNFDINTLTAALATLAAGVSAWQAGRTRAHLDEVNTLRATIVDLRNQIDDLQEQIRTLRAELARYRRGRVSEGTISATPPQPLGASERLQEARADSTGITTSKGAL